MVVVKIRILIALCLDDVDLNGAHFVKVIHIICVLFFSLVVKTGRRVPCVFLSLSRNVFFSSG